MSASFMLSPAPHIPRMVHRHLDVGDMNEALIARRKRSDKHAARVRQLQSRKARARSRGQRG